MAYNPYTSVSVTGYNANPPADDGSEVEANQITWAKHKTKLGDPIKTAVESINTNVAAAFLKRHMSAKTVIAQDYTAVAADYGKVLAVTGTRTIDFDDAATLGEGWSVTIVNVGSGIVTLDGAINGQTFVELAGQNDCATVMSDGAEFIALISLPASSGLVGEMRSMGGTTARNGWLACDGSSIGSADSAATYKGEKYRALFDYLKGNGWGNTGSEDFDSGQTVLLPAMAGKVAVHYDGSHAIGTSGGATTQTPTGSISVSSDALSLSQIPAHNHSGSADTQAAHSHSVPNGGNTVSDVRTDSSATAVGTSSQTTSSSGAHNHSITIGSSGSGSTHSHTANFTGGSMSVEQPWVAVAYMIKY